MYYATKPKAKTPTPFLELRVWLITTKPVSFNIWKPRLEKELDWLEFILSGPRSKAFIQKKLNEEIKVGEVKEGKFSVDIGTPGNTMRYTIIGMEINRKIDLDEAIGTIPPRRGEGITRGNFATTGLPVSEWNFYTTYRYACFFKRNGDLKREYNEREIRILESEAVSDYRVWLKYITESPEFRERYMKWYMARRGYKWKKGYKAYPPYIWKGRPVIAVRYKGRLVKGGILVGRPL